jgi:hypothetical protein
MQSQNLIQTNHGVSFPLVGPRRVEQSELSAAEEEGVKSANDGPQQTSSMLVCWLGTSGSST